jgi:hypothetical protein
MKKITITLTQSQLRDAAMREQGLSPAKVAVKPGTRVHRGQKDQAKRGLSKHKKSLVPHDD